MPNLSLFSRHLSIYKKNYNFVLIITFTTWSTIIKKDMYSYRDQRELYDYFTQMGYKTSLTECHWIYRLSFLPSWLMIGGSWCSLMWWPITSVSFLFINTNEDLSLFSLPLIHRMNFHVKLVFRYKSISHPKLEQTPRCLMVVCWIADWLKLTYPS